MYKFLPIVSFPAAKKLNININDLVNSSSRQKDVLKYISDNLNTDAIVSLMDLTVEAECFGSPINFEINEVPSVKHKIINNIQDANNLVIPKVSDKRCPIYLETIKKLKAEVTDKDIFACCIGPYSLAGRLIGVTEAMMACYEQPEMLEITLDKVTKFLISYINEYKKLGIKGIVMAEPLAGILSPSLAKTFSNKYVKEIIEATQDDDFIIVYHNCGNNVLKMIDSIIESGVNYLHLGNAIDLNNALEMIPKDKVVMGNLDPVLLQNDDLKKVINETEKILKEAHKYSNFVFSTGCDVPVNAKWENLVEIRDTVKKFYEDIR